MNINYALAFNSNDLFVWLTDACFMIDIAEIKRNAGLMLEMLIWSEYICLISAETDDIYYN